MRVLLTRGYQGIGDYLIALAALKIVQRAQPSIEFVCEFNERHGRRGLPEQAYLASDVRYRRAPAPADFEVFDLIYRRWPPDCFIHSTVVNFNEHARAQGHELWIEHEPGVYPEFYGGARHHGRGGYVAMVGHGLGRKREGKEWGADNWKALAHLLGQRGVEIVQLGRAGDRPVCRKLILGQPFKTVHEVLCGARVFVGLESGLMMLSGYLDVPQVTIYDGRGLPRRVSFARQLKLEHRIEPPEAAAAILEYIA